MKNDHIEELQEALKESVTIISMREDDLFQEQIKRKDIQDQVTIVDLSTSNEVVHFFSSTSLLRTFIVNRSLNFFCFYISEKYHKK